MLNMLSVANWYFVPVVNATNPKWSASIKKAAVPGLLWIEY